MLMQLKEFWHKFWKDETGAVLSAELVTVATLGVAGAAVGMDAMSKSVNDELTDVAFAIRSLDQSFCVKPRQSTGACVAGSYFEQIPVQIAHEELRQHQKEMEARQRKEIESSKKPAASKKKVPRKKVQDDGPAED